MTIASPPLTFELGGERTINRLGYGAMRIVGPEVWGPPADPDAAIAVLRRAVELGVDFIDTADAYGPEISERLIRAALHPYAGIVVATKSGLLCPGPPRGKIPLRCGNPDFLRHQLYGCLRRLGLEQLDLWYLHRIDPTVPAEEQFGVLREAIDEGVVRQVGLSEVSVAEIEAARAIVPIAAVQNLYNAADHGSDEVLAYCEQHGIAFVPFLPLGEGALARGAGAVAEVAERHGATPAQIALAWLLRRSPAIVPIPGTSSIAHLEENLAAAEIVLSEDEVTSIAGAKERAE